MAQVSTWRTMLYANDRLLKRLEEEMLREHNLELSWYEVLLHVAEAGGQIGQRALVTRMLMGQSGLSRILTRMEAAQLVRRTAVEADRRNLRVELTEIGRERLRRAVPTHIGGIKRWFGDQLTARQAEAIRAGLGKVLQGLSEEDKAPSPGSPGVPAEVAGGPATPWMVSDPVAVTDTLAVRDALEPLVVADAVHFATTSDIAELRERVTSMAQRTNAPREFFRAVRDLQRRMADISPNLTLRRAYTALLDALDQATDAELPDRVRDLPEGRLRVHACLVEAIAERDEAAAAGIIAQSRAVTSPESRLGAIQTSEAG
jgi:DNA-binding MarR family transcriptional regulator